MIALDTDPPSQLIECLSGADLGALTGLLAEDVKFSSPAADYHGRADVVHMLTLIARVLESPQVQSTAADRSSRLITLTAQHKGQPLEGILRERRDDVGRLVHVTLYLRPYHTLRACIDAMRTLLANAPLPSTRS